MSCVSVNIGSTGYDMSLGMESLFSNADIRIDAQDGAVTDLMFMNQYADIDTGSMDTMGINIMLVCSVGSDNYIFVTPTEAMWVTIDTRIDYDIRSNTDWLIQ